MKEMVKLYHNNTRSALPLKKLRPLGEEFITCSSQNLQPSFEVKKGTWGRVVEPVWMNYAFVLQP